MSFCQKISLTFIAILTHQKLLCAFMDPTLSVSMKSKVIM